MKNILSIVTVVTSVQIATAGVPVRAAAPQIWLAAKDPVISARTHSEGQLDYMALFQPGAAWASAAAHTNVFMIATQFVDHATDDQLNTVIRGLKDRGISLALAALVLVPSPRCGRGVEGYGGAFLIDRVADRIKQLGGTLDYVSFDEPVWFGHHKSGPQNCRDSVQDIATQLIEPASALRRNFPRVSFVDTEPLNNETDENSLQDIRDFAAYFRKSTGFKIDSIHADIIWRSDWQRQYLNWQRLIKADGMRFGVICRGSVADHSDIEWNSEALHFATEVMYGDRPRADDIRVQTWGSLPATLLPDSDPGALTSVIRLMFAN